MTAMPDPASAARVTLIGKPGCHLCDDAREVVARVAREVGVGWRELDITTDERLYARYWEKIPVVLVDGALVAVWGVDEATLRDAVGRPGE